MTPEQKLEQVKFLIWTLPTLIKEGDTLIDELNQQIKCLKGIDILSYYIPTDPTKVKEPLLNINLQRKWLLAKTVEQKQLQEKESVKNFLKQSPIKRERARKKKTKIPTNSENHEKTTSLFYDS